MVQHGGMPVTTWVLLRTRLLCPQASPILLASDFISPELDRKLAWARQELRLSAKDYLGTSPFTLMASLPRLASRLAFLRSQGRVGGSITHTQLDGTRTPPKAAAEVCNLPPSRDLLQILAAPPATFRKWASKWLQWEVGQEELAAWEKAWVASPEGQAWMAK